MSIKQWWESIAQILKRKESYRNKWKNTYFKREMF